jgi:subtilase family serine protease
MKHRNYPPEPIAPAALRTAIIVAGITLAVIVGALVIIFAR